MFGEACKNPYNPAQKWRPWVPPGRSSAESGMVAALVESWSLFSKFMTLIVGSSCAAGRLVGWWTGWRTWQGTGGDFRKCDTLLRFIEAMYKHIATIHPSVDFIYWTGGLPAHDFWNQTKEGGTRK